MISVRSRVPGLNLPWREGEFCVLDIETTGLDPVRDRIISYGAVCVSGGRILGSEAKYGLVNPETEICRESVVIHALTKSDLEGAPTIGECIDDILALLDGRILVAHSAWMEVDFLKAAAKRAHRKFRVQVVDTAVLARPELDLPGLPPDRDVSLEYASVALGLPVHTPHHALGDAMTTAQLFVALSSRLSSRGPCTVGDLVSISRR